MVKYLLLSITLSFLLFIGIIYTITEEISELREGDRLLSQEIMANRAYIGLLVEFHRLKPANSSDTTNTLIAAL